MESEASGWLTGLHLVKLNAPFACYHSVCSTCHFSHVGKLPEQSGTESRVHGVRREIDARTSSNKFTHMHMHAHSLKGSLF